MSSQKQSLDVAQTAHLRLTPAQIQVMKLIEVPAVRLEEEIAQKLEENPALEIEQEDDGGNEDELLPDEEEQNNENDDAYTLEDYYENDEYDSSDVSDYELIKINQSKDDKTYERVIVEEESFQENLLSQLSLLEIDTRKRKIAEYLIGNIEDDGYIKQNNLELASDLLTNEYLECSTEEIENVIRQVIQTLEPTGVGARDLQECLTLQLAALPASPAQILARQIIANCFTEFKNKHYDKILKKNSCSESDLKAAIAIIQKLNPKPGGTHVSHNNNMADTITPDFLIIEENNKLQLSLNRNFIPRLKVNSLYEDLYAQYRAKKKKEKLSQQQSDEEKIIKEQVEQAREFIDFLSSRDETLYRTMKAIMEWQYDYFRTGDSTQLRPMILEDIAKKTGYDKSTISRVSNCKYVQTDFGIIPLKRLFAEAVGQDDTSSREIKEAIAKLVASEDKTHPINDDKLAKLLERDGYAIARRTIAKYREELKIPVARLRKKL